MTMYGRGDDLPPDIFEQIRLKRLTIPGPYLKWTGDGPKKPSMTEAFIEGFREIAKQADGYPVVAVYRAPSQKDVLICLRNQRHWASVEGRARQGAIRYALVDLWCVGIDKTNCTSKIPGERLGECCLGNLVRSDEHPLPKPGSEAWAEEAQKVAMAFQSSNQVTATPPASRSSSVSPALHSPSPTPAGGAPPPST